MLLSSVISVFDVLLLLGEGLAWNRNLFDASESSEAPRLSVGRVTHGEGLVGDAHARQPLEGLPLVGWEVAAWGLLTLAVLRGGVFKHLSALQRFLLLSQVARGYACFSLWPELVDFHQLRLLCLQELLDYPSLRSAASLLQLATVLPVRLFPEVGLSLLSEI